MPRSIREIAIILLFIAGGLVILFSTGTKPGDSAAARALYTVIRPIQHAVYGIHHRIGGIWNSYFDLVGVREENRSLQEEIRKLRRQRSVLLFKERENRRLRKLLDLKRQHEFPSIAARVIGEDAVGWYRTLFIDRGSSDGVLTEMPVTVAEGVVGRVTRNSQDMSQVTLLTDPGLTVGCRIARTRDRGVLSGSLESGCVLRYIRLESDVRPGDEVVTSGMDGIFPRGLPVGRIESVTKGEQGLFLEARVTPAVNFSDIEEVLVVLGRRGGFDVRPGLEDRP
ncbi:MAG: rod shape-determining protein MreC [Desulfomonilaceae bacterium]|nr:rod shape-determining protein MreC [Desulfomonilaceae bacterium]